MTEPRIKVKTSYLPVALTPTIFFPLSAIGHPWLWIGVGLSNPCFITSLSTYSGMLASSNVRQGFGTPSPITTICLLARQASASLSGRFVTSGCSM